MIDDPSDDTTEIELNGPMVVEIDALAIAQIIAQAIKVEPRLAIKAANRVLEYLMTQHNNPLRPQ